MSVESDWRRSSAEWAEPLRLVARAADVKDREQVVGIGIDLVDVLNLRDVLLRGGSRLMRRIFTEQELEHGGALERAGTSEPATIWHWAQCFAAKEAAMKALGTGWAGKVRWTDASFSSEASGHSPHLRLTGELAQISARRKVTRTVCSSATSHSNLKRLPSVERSSGSDRGDVATCVQPPASSQWVVAHVLLLTCP